MKAIAFAALSLVVTVALIGCDNDESPKAKLPPISQAAINLPEGFIAREALPGAQGVTAVKSSAKDGDTVVVAGKVAGSEEPLAKNRAMMTILDPSIPTCDAMPGDACKTPWDACCEPHEKVAANSATVQLVGADGKPRGGSLEGIANLKPLSRVTVSGIARRPAGGDSLVIEAKSIHVDPPTPTTKPAK